MDKKTGKPVYKAMFGKIDVPKSFVKLRKQNKDKIVFNKTGLLIDSYFSGTKIKWILDNIPTARKLMNKNNCYLEQLIAFNLETYKKQSSRN